MKHDLPLYDPLEDRAGAIIWPFLIACFITSGYAYIQALNTASTNPSLAYIYAVIGFALTFTVGRILYQLWTSND